MALGGKERETSLPFAPLQNGMHTREGVAGENCFSSCEREREIFRGIELQDKGSPHGPC